MSRSRPENERTVTTAAEKRAGFPAIPNELKERPQWGVWRSEPRGGKPTKIPYDPATGGHASSTELLTWRPFEVALEVLETGIWDGLGFVFCSGDPYTGIDLDGCRDPNTGELTPAARSIVDSFEGAYMELSPPRRGVHMETYDWSTSPESTRIRVGGPVATDDAYSRSLSSPGMRNEDNHSLKRSIEVVQFRGREKPAPREWLTYEEARRLVGISRTTLWKLVRSGSVKGARVGRSVRINRTSLGEYTASQSPESGAE